MLIAQMWSVDTSDEYWGLMRGRKLPVKNIRTILWIRQVKTLPFLWTGQTRQHHKAHHGRMPRPVDTQS